MSTIVSGYINQIAEQSSESKRYIYRGQSKIYDGITSTAKRRFKHSDLTPNEDEYFEYHTNLIKDAKSYRYGQESELNDTELLIDLQHYGAATGLIDFSEDLLIALWFACDKPDENGKVFFLDVWTDQFKHLASENDLFKEEDKTKRPYYLHTNFKSNARISAQKGVFIFGYQDIDNVASITIKKEDKVSIRQELKQYFNIEEKTLFQDIYGFAQVNNTKHKLSIKTASDYFQEAYEEDNAEQAIVLYQKSIGIKPDDAAYYNMGNAYGELGEYQKAINAYKKAIEIKPDYDGAYNNMGVAYNELKEYQKAINACQKAIEIKPGMHEAYNNMGNAYGELGEYQKAINAYKKAIEIKHDKHEAYYNMGIAYGKLGEYQKAINAYQKAIEIKPDYDGAYNNMGVAYGELGEYQKAINAYKKAIEIKPDMHEAYNNMGNAYNELGEYQKAINAYKKAIEIKPDMHEAYNNMGNAYNELKEYQKAINTCQKAIEIKPDEHNAYYNMGIAYGELGEYQKAINAYKKAIEIKPDEHNAYYNMGNTYRELKKYQKAINAYQKSIEIEPSLINHAKKQNFDWLESYINNLDDSPVKQQNLFILNQLKGHG